MELIAAVGRGRRSLSRSDTRRPLLAYEEYTAERNFRPLAGVRAISVLLVITSHVNSSLWAWLSGWRFRPERLHAAGVVAAPPPS